jgi:hypothetical protein
LLGIFVVPNPYADAEPGALPEDPSVPGRGPPKMKRKGANTATAAAAAAAEATAPGAAAPGGDDAAAAGGGAPAAAASEMPAVALAAPSAADAEAVAAAMAGAGGGKDVKRRKVLGHVPAGPGRKKCDEPGCPKNARDAASGKCITHGGKRAARQGARGFFVSMTSSSLFLISQGFATHPFNNKSTPSNSAT